jgi:hypothetical protein
MRLCRRSTEVAGLAGKRMGFRNGPFSGVGRSPGHPDGSVSRHPRLRLAAALALNGSDVEASSTMRWHAGGMIAPASSHSATDDKRSHADKSSSNPLASFRSRVSNPSVNQPYTGTRSSRAASRLP